MAITDSNITSAGNQQQPGEPDNNPLFPIFVKLDQLSLLIVGGGYVGFEKLTAVLQNSPKAKIKLVATAISDEIKTYATAFPLVELVERPYQAEDIDGHDLVIAAINDPAISRQVGTDAKLKGKLVNVADKPALCDFYLGSVVQKGSLKIAISTNGKSPTVAKRIKEVLNETIPAELDNVLDNMQIIRNKISGDFTEKVKQLNEITKTLTEQNNHAK